MKFSTTARGLAIINFIFAGFNLALQMYFWYMYGFKFNPELGLNAVIVVSNCFVGYMCWKESEKKHSGL